MIEYTKGIIAVIVIAILTSGFFYAKNHYINIGHNEVLEQWEKDKIEREKAHKIALINAVSELEKEYKRQLQVNASVIADYEKKLNEAYAKISAERVAYERKRLRFDTDKDRLCGSTEAAKGTSTVEPNGTGTTVTVELPDAITKSLYDIAESADREVARLKSKLSAFQKWAIENGHYEVADGNEKEGNTYR